MNQKSGKNIMKFIRSSSIFFLGNILSKAITFLLLPIYTKIIQVDEMGYFDVSITYINIAVSLLYFEIWSAILRFMYDSKSRLGKNQSIKDGAVIFLGSTSVYLLAALVLGAIVPIRSFAWVICYGLMQSLVSYFSFCTRGLQHDVDFAISGIINVMVNALVNILLIVKLHVGYETLYIGYIAGSFVQIIYLELRTGICRAIASTRTDFSRVKQMFLYSIPLCINTVSYWLMTGFNRLAINWELGNASNGIYAIGNKFGMLISMVTTCFTYAWQDLSFSYAVNKKERGQFYSTGCNLYTKFLMTGMLILLPLCKWVFPIIIDDNYAQAEVTIPLFLLIGVLSAISAFIGNVFYAIKDTKTLFFSSVISAGVNVVLVFPLIRYGGINGANLSVALCFVLNIVIRCVLLRKKIGFSFDWVVFVSLICWCVISFYIFSRIGVIGCAIMFVANIAIGMLFFRNEMREFLNVKTSKKRIPEMSDEKRK